MDTSQNSCCSSAAPVVSPETRPASQHAALLDIEALAQAKAQVSLELSSTLTGARGDVLVLAAVPASSCGCDDDESGVRLLTDGAACDGVDVASLERLLPDLGFAADLDETMRVPATGLTQADVRSILVVGAGKALEWASDASRDSASLGEDRPGVLWRLAGRAARALTGVQRAVVALPCQTLTDFEAVTLGIGAGAYSWEACQPAPTCPLKEAVILLPTGVGDTGEGSLEDYENCLDKAVALSGAIALTRNLVNEPPNRLTPASFASVAQAAGELAGLEVEVLDEQELARQGFGGILGVGQGSVHPPRLVRASWVPQQPHSRVALIGKGITFDSGGLSLKPAASMPEMKSDMAGAATVLATVIAAAHLQVPVRVDAWLALAENLPSTDAQRPSDIVTMYGGTSVEITNTDAEGRLVMADALARAAEDEPDALVDVATLTGAQMVALGARISGVMGTPVLRDLVVTCGAANGEAFWAMPLPEHLRPALDSHYASMTNANMAHRWGGMLTAGLFLREFVGDLPWAHLDVAGPAFNDGAAWGPVPTGGTGFAVRTLVSMIHAIADGEPVR